MSKYSKMLMAHFLALNAQSPFVNGNIVTPEKNWDPITDNIGYPELWLTELINLCKSVTKLSLNFKAIPWNSL